MEYTSTTEVSTSTRLQASDCACGYEFGAGSVSAAAREVTYSRPQEFQDQPTIEEACRC